MTSRKTSRWSPPSRLACGCRRPGTDGGLGPGPGTAAGRINQVGDPALGRRHRRYLSLYVAQWNLRVLTNQAPTPPSRLDPRLMTNSRPSTSRPASARAGPMPSGSMELPAWVDASA